MSHNTNRGFRKQVPDFWEYAEVCGIRIKFWLIDTLWGNRFAEFLFSSAMHSKNNLVGGTHRTNENSISHPGAEYQIKFREESFSSSGLSRRLFSYHRLYALIPGDIEGKNFLQVQYKYNLGHKNKYL